MWSFFGTKLGNESGMRQAPAPGIDFRWGTCSTTPSPSAPSPCPPAPALWCATTSLLRVLKLLVTPLQKYILIPPWKPYQVNGTCKSWRIRRKFRVHTKILLPPFFWVVSILLGRKQPLKSCSFLSHQCNQAKPMFKIKGSSSQPMACAPQVAQISVLCGIQQFREGIGSTVAD